MKEPWTDRLDIAARRIPPEKSTRSEKFLWPIETGVGGSSLERFAGDGIGLNPMVFSRI
jgi:hypothetical protein